MDIISKIAHFILKFLDIIIWPGTIIFLIIIFKNEIKKLLLRAKKANFPGGSFEAFPEQLEEAKVLSEEVSQEAQNKNKTENTPNIPLTEINARLLNLDLSPSPSGLDFSYYRDLSENDPNLALAGLRMDLELMLKNVAKGFNVDIARRESIGRLTSKLKKENAITQHQAELISTVVELCNKAVHGTKVSSFQAKEILDVAEILREQFIYYLSWGFPEK